MVPKLLPKTNQAHYPGRLLLQGQYKRESIFLQKEDRLSFCINLEVVIFQDSEFGLFFGRSFETIICFRNLLTFNCPSSFRLPLTPLIMVTQKVNQQIGCELIFDQIPGQIRYQSMIDVSCKKRNICLTSKKPNIEYQRLNLNKKQR